jgi:DNA repair exonuclease SbcCD ATPase subunit
MDDLSIQRDNLLSAIAQLQDERQRLTSLEEAREKAREQSRVASSKLTEAETNLRQARDAEPQRLAYAFASGGINAVSPLSSAQLALEAAQAEASQIKHIEQALDTELVQVNNRLRDRQTALHQALAGVVCNSAEFHHLFDELTNAFARIRGIRKACRQIQRALQGQMPDEFSQRWQSEVSLDPDDIRDATGPIPTDERPALA